MSKNTPSDNKSFDQSLIGLKSVISPQRRLPLFAPQPSPIISDKISSTVSA